MSHRATNWAIEQRGLKPATRIVLWHLADRHNPDFGCFPSQLDLARDCELSPSALNEHLKILEDRGLIKRIRRYDPETRRSRSTRYILCFEADFTQEPTPDSGVGVAAEPTPDFADSRLRNPESNPVREPVSTTAARADAHGCGREEREARFSEALGSWLAPVSRNELRLSIAILDDWEAAGFDPDLDIVPVLLQRAPQLSGRTIRTWDYFTPAIAAAHANRVRQAERAKVAENIGKRDPDRETPNGAPPEPAGPRIDPIERLAAWINDGTFLPPSAVSTRQRDELIRRGLVTPEQLRERQIY